MNFHLIALVFTSSAWSFAQRRNVHNPNQVLCIFRLNEPHVDDQNKNEKLLWLNS
jgi:hypothetical protein